MSILSFEFFLFYGLFTYFNAQTYKDANASDGNLPYIENGPYCGQPMFNYSSTSRHPEKQTPMHQERGFFRIKPGTNEIAFIVSHNFGLTSIKEGKFHPETMEISLETVSIDRISFAKPPIVKKNKRNIKLLSPDMLEITVYMETETTPLKEHLKAIYSKVDKV